MLIVFLVISIRVDRQPFLVVKRQPDDAYLDLTDDVLPAECLILILEPGERLFEMLWLEIQPVFISDIHIRVHRLHRKKTAQTASASMSWTNPFMTIPYCFRLRGGRCHSERGVAYPAA